MYSERLVHLSQGLCQSLTFLFEGEVLREVPALVVPTQEEECGGVVDLERPEVENTLGGRERGREETGSGGEGKGKDVREVTIMHKRSELLSVRVGGCHCCLIYTHHCTVLLFVFEHL